TGNSSNDATGPWLSWNCGRKSPLGVSMRPVTEPYSSLGATGRRSSTVESANPARITQSCLRDHANPARGWKLFQSFAYRALGWLMTPMPPDTTLSAPVGSKLETCPYLLFSELCACQRTPRFSVKLLVSFQSS